MNNTFVFSDLSLGTRFTCSKQRRTLVHEVIDLDPGSGRVWGEYFEWDVMSSTVVGFWQDLIEQAFIGGRWRSPGEECDLEISEKDLVGV